MYRARLQTGHFDFEAYGSTEADARAALDQGFAEHARQYRMSVETFRSNFADDVEIQSIELGHAYRDRELLK
jgi:hypothetical protein